MVVLLVLDTTVGQAGGLKQVSHMGQIFGVIDAFDVDFVV